MIPGSVLCLLGSGIGLLRHNVGVVLDIYGLHISVSISYRCLQHPKELPRHSWARNALSNDALPPDDMSCKAFAVPELPPTVHEVQQPQSRPVGLE